MANILPKEDQIQILTLLVESNSIRSTSRITGCHKKTVTRVLVDFGNGCRDFLDAELRSLTLGHVQVDEMWTFVAKKQARLTYVPLVMRLILSQFPAGVNGRIHRARVRAVR